MHFSQRMIFRTQGLLPMLYTPSELEHELGIPAYSIRDWVKLGMPHERDERGRLWINGMAFAGWVNHAKKEGTHTALKKDEAFCLHCKQAVRLEHPQIARTGKHILLSGQCPVCHTPIHRGGRIDSSG